MSNSTMKLIEALIVAEPSVSLPKITNAIDVFEDSVIARSWSGAGRPEDAPLTEAEYAAAKQDLVFTIMVAIHQNAQTKLPLTADAKHK